MDTRDRLIVSQVAAKCATDLVCAELASGVHLNVESAIDAYSEHIFSYIFELAGSPLEAAAVAASQTRHPSAAEQVDNVVKAFPGTQVVDDEEALTAEPPYAPDTKVPAEVRANKQWAVATLKADLAGKTFFKGWWDNRESAAGTRRPILKHKDTGVALWPDDVPEGLDIPVSKFAK